MNTHTLHLRILQERLGEIACELTQIRFHAPGAQPPWQPKTNIYRGPDRIIICAELAGVERAEIDLVVEPFRVGLRGQRRIPELAQASGPLQQIFALEIDEGGFGREIVLPEEVVPEQASAEQRNGILWIDLPLRSPDQSSTALSP